MNDPNYHHNSVIGGATFNLKHDMFFRIFKLGLLTILVNILFKHKNFIFLPVTCPKIL